MKQNKLVIITPCFNEEEIIEYSIEQLSLLLNIMIMDNLVSADSMIVFVNDGSNDKTEEIIMPGTTKSAVEIEWNLKAPVREDIYEYIVKE